MAASTLPAVRVARLHSGPVTVAIVGAGARGKTYARYALEHPELMQVVSVAEPRPFHRELVAKRCVRRRETAGETRHAKRPHSFRIPPTAVFEDWSQLSACERLADAVVIATQDHMHKEPAVALAALGYHILLEKPMAVTAQDCRAIVAAVKAAGVILAVGHVLRYTPYMQRMKALITSGAIGEVVNVQHLEPIGNWHFAHSYVRGAWAREDASTFMLMAKCCHDVDLIRYIVGQPCSRVSSFGALTHFRREKKPAEAGTATRCMDCVLQDRCPYSAKTIYLQRAASEYFGWPVSTIIDGEPSVPAVQAALATGPYGRCVWECDNDVADHQVVAMQFEGGASATLTTAAFTEAICQRRTRVFGSLGELEGDGDTTIRHFDFRTGTAQVYETEGAPAGSGLTGHNGADYHLIASFVRAVATGDAGAVLSGPDETLESHLIVFAAEAARRAGVVVSISDVVNTGLASAVASSATVAVGARVAAAAASAPLPGAGALALPPSASASLAAVPGMVPPHSSGAVSSLAQSVLPAGATVTAHIATSASGTPVLHSPGSSLVTVTTSAPLSAPAMPPPDEPDVVLRDLAAAATPPFPHPPVPAAAAAAAAAAELVSTHGFALMTAAVPPGAAPAVSAVPVSLALPGVHGGGRAVSTSVPLHGSLPILGSPGTPTGGTGAAAAGSWAGAGATGLHALPAAISVSISAHPTAGLPGGTHDTAGVAIVPVAAAVGSVLGAIQSVTHATSRATAVGEPAAPPHATGPPGAAGLQADAAERLLQPGALPTSPPPASPVRATLGAGTPQLRPQ